MRTGVRWHGPRRSFDEWMTPAILVLLIANTGVFFLEILVMWLQPGGMDAILKYFGLMPYGVTRALRVWQPFTYLFLHGDLGHYFWNMLSLWMFGRDLERAWGTKRFYWFYFVTGVGAGLINVVYHTIAGSPQNVVIIGASGAIYGVLMANAILFPDRIVALLFPPVSMPMRFFVFVWGLLAFFGTLLPSGGNVSHFTHLSGMAVAYFYLRRGSFLYKLRNRYSDWQRARAKRRFEVYMRKQQDEPPSRPDNWVN